MPGALLTATDCTGHVHLIVGHNPLASSRASRSLDLGAKVKILAPKNATLHYNLQQKVDEGTVEWIQKETVSRDDLISLGRPEVDGIVDAVFVTLQVGCAQNAQISSICKKLRIPINVADTPSLCSFTLLSTYSDGPLHIGVTTSGRGCKLASRIRREIASSLPPQLGSTCDRLGSLRRRIWEEDYAHSGGPEDAPPVFEDEDLGQAATFNKLVPQGEFEAAKGRRIRWLSQMCEYWPLEKLCALKDGDIDGLLEAYNKEARNNNTEINITLPPASPNSSPIPTQPSSSSSTPPIPSSPSLQITPTSTGKILLVGSGPGHPDLLTTAALNAITTADLILADKLVPPPVLALIPRRTPVHIARKFPGNADAAQQELLNLGLSALKEGKRVVRLKQGDPYIYGRGGEEHIFFSEHGYTPIVVPGITSALSAGVFAGIPLTHRGVSDQVLICTGTGRKGDIPVWPEYVKGRTTVLLMALHRLSEVVEGLKGKGWGADMPCAVVERASCKDQRVVRCTLGEIVSAVEEVGSRPPGLLVVGEACGVLERGVIGKEGKRWVVEEGFGGF